MRLARGLTEPFHLFERIVRNPDVRRLELAWAASNFASRASAIAVAVYAYEVDGVGAVGIIVFLRLAIAGGASPGSPSSPTADRAGSSWSPRISSAA